MKFSVDKPITEQLNLRYPLRTYLDDASDEFKSTSIEEKINTLAQLVGTGFDLNHIVKQYKHKYCLQGYKI
jgi:hypothetical protein